MIATLKHRASRALGHSPWRLRHGPALKPLVHLFQDKPLVVLPGVFDPIATVAGAWLATEAAALVQPGQRCLEVGTGSGLVALHLHQRGAQSTALDIDPQALHNARLNAALWGLPWTEQRPDNSPHPAIEIFQSDLFAGIYPQRHWDLIVANLPFWEGEPDGSFWSRAMRAGKDFSLLRRFAREFRQFAPQALLVIAAGAPATGARAALGNPPIVKEAEFLGERLSLLKL